MLRKIIQIDEEKCNGCTLCLSACHEGAIGLVDGKAKLLRDDYCDGLGDCLPVCPTEAITFVEREAAAYDERAVQANMKQNLKDPFDKKTEHKESEKLPCGCPGSNSKKIERKDPENTTKQQLASQLNQWPVQIKLVPVKASYFENANLLIAADCSAYAHGNFHKEFMENKITLIGCPKLDEGEYSEKLTSILKFNNIKSLTVVRMEVPCCGGIASAAIIALQNCGKMIPWQIVTISTDGKVLDN